VRRARPLALELRVESPGGRVRRYRLGRRATAAVLLGVTATLAGLALGVVSLPALAAASRVRREMNVALERRTQLGARLRALVDAYVALDQQVREHAARVERIRRLYGLPEIPLRSESEAVVRGASQTIFGAAILHGRRVDQTIEAVLARTDAELAVLTRWERDRPEEVRSVPVLAPIRAADAVVVSAFGPRRNPLSEELEFHAGLDLAAPAGATIRAPSDASVVWAGEAPAGAGESWWRLGRVVVLAHGRSYRSLFGHCDRILVRAGQRIRAGAPIATVGKSGWTPTPRLHYEVRHRAGDADWEPIDPLTLVLDPAWAPLAANAPAIEREADGASPLPLPRPFAR
jgi:murein DD-endopeptidase MepM/ murein hydrolase activator NlpD